MKEYEAFYGKTYEYVLLIISVISFLIAIINAIIWIELSPLIVTIFAFIGAIFVALFFILKLKREIAISLENEKLFLSGRENIIVSLHDIKEIEIHEKRKIIKIVIYRTDLQKIIVNYFIENKYEKIDEFLNIIKGKGISIKLLQQ